MEFGIDLYLRVGTVGSRSVNKTVFLMFLIILKISILLLLTFIVFRLYYIVFKFKPNNALLVKRQSSVPTLICLGSGGHTKEIIAILQEMNFTNYSPRHYLLAETDITSLSKVETLESDSATDFVVHRITRSRAVKQSNITSIFTTIVSTIECIPLLLKIKPELILCNGPGTCVPICLVSILLKVFFINSQCRIVFVESFCRVKSLSLSGKILLYFTDLFAVHWEDLKQFSNRIEYFGKLM